MELTTSITLYGEIIKKPDTLLNWYEYSKQLIKQFGVTPNYIAAKSESFKSGKILDLARMEGKLKKAINECEEMEYIALYSLPDNFQIAARDYSILLGLYNNLQPTFITLTVRKELISRVSNEDIINGFKQFMIFENGQIYDMDVEETPLLYASKANADSSYKTLNVLKRF